MSREPDEITAIIIEEAIELHRRLGPGLMESVYEAVLAKMLRKRGLEVVRQALVRIEIDGEIFDEGFRADLIVVDCVIVELKSIERLLADHKKQLLTYLRLAHMPVGLLLNFGAPTMKAGLRRVVNNYQPSADSRLRVNQG